MRKTPAPTVFIVDDDSNFRETIRDMLEMHGYVAEIFADAFSFLQTLSPKRAACLITDARMPGIGGHELIERLRARQSSLPIIMITGYGDVAMAVTAMKAGAFDFLQKPVRQHELLDCIDRALKYSDERPGSAERKIAATKIESLTDRQRQILDLILVGVSNKNIAADLNIAQRTAENHRAVIMRKVGAKSLSDLIRIAFTARAALE